MFAEPEKNKRYVIFIICISLALLGMNLLFNSQQETPKELIKTDASNNELLAKQQIKSTVKKDKIKVCLSGAVPNPGIHSVEKGSRVEEVLEMFGGVDEQADLTKVNLARVCRDGTQIAVPWKKGLSNKANKKFATVNSTQQHAVDEKININQASKAELITLPGVGPDLADAVINYRKKNGNFKSAQELLKVSGIGSGKLNKLESLITW